MNATAFYFESLMTQESTEIARGLRRRDPDLLDRLIEQYQHRLLRYLVYLTGRRELAEELSFADADVRDIACTGVAEDIAICQPELIFTAWSNRTRAQIEAAFDRTEHHATWSTPATAEGIEAAVRSDEVFTPVAIAAMLLYGRAAFGEAFFNHFQTTQGGLK